MNNIKIPSYVSAWTDKYFHQSAFDIPLGLPNIKIINFLSSFKPTSPIKLFRGINNFNNDNKCITSWTYNKKIAKTYADDSSEIIEKIFQPEEILLDTTKLNNEQRMLLGYDYKIDDQEVLILN